jgi:hypothetical protein
MTTRTISLIAAFGMTLRRETIKNHAYRAKRACRGDSGLREHRVPMRR